MAVDRPHTPETPAADDPSPSQTSSMLQTSFYDVDENRKIVLEQLPQSAFAAGSASRSWKHRPPLPQTELYSRSLNDISSLMNKTRDREEDTHSEILRMRSRQPQSQPTTPPPSLKNRLLKRLRTKRPWEVSHEHSEDCQEGMAAAKSQIGHLRRRNRESTQMHTSSEDEDATELLVADDVKSNGPESHHSAASIDRHSNRQEESRREGSRA